MTTEAGQGCRQGRKSTAERWAVGQNDRPWTWEASRQRANGPDEEPPRLVGKELTDAVAGILAEHSGRDDSDGDGGDDEDEQAGDSGTEGRERAARGGEADEDVGDEGGGAGEDEVSIMKLNGGCGAGIKAQAERVQQGGGDGGRPAGEPGRIEGRMVQGCQTGPGARRI